MRRPEGALSPNAYVAMPPVAGTIAVGLTGIVLAVRDGEPVVAVVPGDDAGRALHLALPCGLFSAGEHESLEDGVKACVETQTGLRLRQVRQVSAVSIRRNDGDAACGIDAPFVVSISYLSLVAPGEFGGDRVAWQSWYAYFPWEDWRQGRPACLERDIEPRLRAWAGAAPACAQGPASRAQRVRLAFGMDGGAWDEEKVSERYEILCEAGLAGGSERGTDMAAGLPNLPRLRHAVLGDHGLVLAGAIAELRRMIKFRPAVFDLMPELFTLFELQKTVEAILGPHLHKQNFRRLVESGGLVEPTDQYRFRTGGRPARLYRFRCDVLHERLAPGVRVKTGRA